MSISSSKKPKIVVYAGPNGSGKSSITSALTVVGTYINPDDIKKDYDLTDLEAALIIQYLQSQLFVKRIIK